MPWKGTNMLFDVEIKTTTQALIYYVHYANTVIIFLHTSFESGTAGGV